MFLWIWLHLKHVSDGMALEIARTRVRHKIANVCRVFQHIVAVTFWFTSISTSVPVSLVAFEACYDGMILHAVNDVCCVLFDMKESCAHCATLLIAISVIDCIYAHGKMYMLVATDAWLCAAANGVHTDFRDVARMQKLLTTMRAIVWELRQLRSVYQLSKFRLRYQITQ